MIVFLCFKADELSCELQCMVREGLSQVIEDEMKEAYGPDMWYVSPLLTQMIKTHNESL